MVCVGKYFTRVFRYYTQIGITFTVTYLRMATRLIRLVFEHFKQCIKRLGHPPTLQSLMLPTLTGTAAVTTGFSGLYTLERFSLALLLPVSCFELALLEMCSGLCQIGHFGHIIYMKTHLVPDVKQSNYLIYFNKCNINITTPILTLDQIYT